MGCWRHAAVRVSVDDLAGCDPRNLDLQQHKRKRTAHYSLPRSDELYDGPAGFQQPSFPSDDDRWIVDRGGPGHFDIRP